MQHSLSSGSLKISVSSLGAELTSLASSSGLEYLWQADKEVWPRHAPVLFPIVGRLKGNAYTFNNVAYALSQHGFARDHEFALADSSNSHCTFELNASAETKKIFPFDFSFRITYRLEENRLSCSYEVANPAQDPLFFSVGAHPGFNCPLLPGEKFDEYYMEFEREELYYTALDNGLLTDQKKRLVLENKRLYLSAGLFDQDALVFENGQINRISLCCSRSEHKVSMECNNWPYFGIWAKKGVERFVCLEPWYGIADHWQSESTLLQKKGILRLEAGQHFNCSFSVTIS